MPAASYRPPARRNPNSAIRILYLDASELAHLDKEYTAWAASLKAKMSFFAIKGGKGCAEWREVALQTS